MFSSLSGRAAVLDEKEEIKLLASNPNIIGSIPVNRNLQFWVLSSDGKGVIWCETFVNEDKVRTETICFDDVDPDD
tara:strand:+ start:144 stop:371 length:228 start_codon:yes stop_codon:yes gene_type:complete